MKISDNHIQFLALLNVISASRHYFQQFDIIFVVKVNISFKNINRSPFICDPSVDQWVIRSDNCKSIHCFMLVDAVSLQYTTLLKLLGLVRLKLVLSAVFVFIGLIIGTNCSAML